MNCQHDHDATGRTKVEIEKEVKAEAVALCINIYHSTPLIAAASYPYVVIFSRIIGDSTSMPGLQAHLPTHPPHHAHAPSDTQDVGSVVFSVFCSAALSIGPTGLLSSLLSVFWLSSAGASLEAAWPWSLTFFEVAPAWLWLWRSGSGDWRPALGADMVAV